MSTATVSFHMPSVENGWARAGQLVQMKSTGQLYKVTKVMKVNYQILDEDGKLWKIKFAGVKEAPDGAVWGGPDAAPVKKPAMAFYPGNIVRVAGSAKFPHVYLVVRETAANRYKLQQIGGDQVLTAGGHSLIGAYKEFEDVL